MLKVCSQLKHSAGNVLQRKKETDGAGGVFHFVMLEMVNILENMVECLMEVGACFKIHVFSALI